MTLCSRFALSLQNNENLLRMKNIYILLICLSTFFGNAFSKAEISHPLWNVNNSVAGFFPVRDYGRSVYSLNPGWLLWRSDLKGAEQTNFDDSQWTRVSLPNGIEFLPAEASGGKNYQGPVWYRKHLRLPSSLSDKKIFVYFEAIMGRSEIWLNGQKLTTHTGGYLPIILDVTGKIKQDADNVIAVRADNSNDGSYPPGKPQYQLDFTYAGGIYRDCWLIAHNKTYITDANNADKVAGGGLFVSYNHISAQQADIRADLEICNEQPSFKGRAVWRLVNPAGRVVWEEKQKLTLSQNKCVTLTARKTLSKPDLWSPENPNLYKMYVSIEDNKSHTVDGYYQRIGIRSIEFKGADGLWLNGKPYEPKLIGANRHQDFAIVGNALTNSMHRRDALKLRAAGMKVIRNAHYPQDPAFMDACDELGLFVICPTPGWQYWNGAPEFEQHVYSDIRQIVRRDRNRPSVFLYEPILNETAYPDSFAVHAVRTVKEEYPYPYVACACDSRQRGKEHFDVWYCHPITGNPDDHDAETDSSKTYFTREFGDDVDDWGSHNSPSRAARNWGEAAMLIQAQHYADPPYQYTSLESLWKMPRKHLGGAIWHPFDHQRGYHPDPFYGGIMDAFRQPKYSYYMFCSQRDPQENSPVAEKGPMVFIANAFTPFSPADVTVYSNCDEVRLTIHRDGKTLTYKKDTTRQGMRNPIITFPDVWHFQDDKALAREGKQQDAYFLAEGLINGQVVATDKEWPARRSSKLVLWADNEGMDLHADGSDIVTIICAVEDENGMIKRLNNERILFRVEGEGQLLGNEQNGGNPVSISWGTAPILLRATTKPGDIKIYASVVNSGDVTPKPAELILHSVTSEYPLLFEQKLVPSNDARPTIVRPTDHHQLLNENELQKKLQEVSDQQKAFE
jgi:beta-galactosidase